MKTSVSLLHPACVPLLACLACLPATAAPEPVLEDEPATQKIRDNLFLLEEAYNQEPGVIQHIQGFQMSPRSGEWTYSFTEEWPLPTDLNQLSVTVPLAGLDGTAALCDILVNYRLQAIGLGGKGRLAVAPRLSLVLPTGDYRAEHGRGGVGIQTNLPVSLDLGPRFTLHLNAGLTWIPDARSPEGARYTALDASGGAAIVYLPRTWFNLLVEVIYAAPDLEEASGSLQAPSLTVNPGVRFAIDHRSGLQIVPGLSAPVQVSGSDVRVSALAYLSFEHPLW